MAYNPNQPRDPAGSSTGGEWTGSQLDTIERAARKAAGLETQSDSLSISASQISQTGHSIISELPNGIKTKSAEVGVTGHGFRYMSEAEYKKFVAGKWKYGGTAQDEMERGIMFANTPGDFYYAGGNMKMFLIEVNKQATSGGLIAPRGSVGLESVVGAWFYNPKTKAMENLIRKP